MKRCKASIVPMFHTGEGRYSKSGMLAALKRQEEEHGGNAMVAGADIDDFRAVDVAPGVEGDDV